MRKKLRDTDYDKISKKLLDTRGNVYYLAKSMFDNYEWKDEDFDKIKKRCKIFKCENCNTWQDVSDEGVTDVCNQCCDKMAGSSDSEEDEWLRS